MIIYRSRRREEYKKIHKKGENEKMQNQKQAVRDVDIDKEIEEGVEEIEEGVDELEIEDEADIEIVEEEEKENKKRGKRGGQYLDERNKM